MKKNFRLISLITLWVALAIILISGLCRSEIIFWVWCYMCIFNLAYTTHIFENPKTEMETKISNFITDTIDNME